MDRLDRAGRVVLVALTLVTLVVVAGSALLRLGSQDLYAAIAEAGKAPDEPARTAYGRWVGAQLSAEVPPGDYAKLRARADELSYKSDRVRELAAVPAIIGMLVALLTDAPDSSDAKRRETSQPVAKTTSSGIA
jgi:hypothetical protein